jgi:hypothetical protein
MIWGWTNPDLSIIALPRRCMTSVIDNPPDGALRSAEPHNFAADPWDNLHLSYVAGAPGIRVPGGDLSQPAEIMGPAFHLAGALLNIGQARVGQAQQRSVRLLDQIDLDHARPWFASV